MNNSQLRIAAIGTANPPCRMSQALAARLCHEHYGELLRPRSLEMFTQVLKHPSIRSRRVAVDRLDCLPMLKNEDPDARVDRFTRWAVSLSAEAAGKALARAGLQPADVGVLVVNTCTGYLCPGVSTYLIERLGLRSDVTAMDLVGSGCGGAIPNLQMGDEPSLLISNAIFGDGAAAALLWDRPAGMRIAGIASHYLPEHRDDVRYVYSKGQLHNRLAPQLPRLICAQVPAFIRRFLAEHELTERDIGHWALHPGGDKMVSGLQRELQLSDAQLEPTRTVLARFGNMSSPTVLFIARRVLTQAGRGGPRRLLMCAYGAGLSMHVCLLEN